MQLSMLGSTQMITTMVLVMVGTKLLNSWALHTFQNPKISSKSPVPDLRLTKMPVYTKTPKKLVFSQLEETVLPKSSLIMSLLVVQRITGLHSGSTPWKSGNGYKMLRWTCLNTWLEHSLITGLVKDIKFHSKLLIYGKVTPQSRSNRLVHNLLTVLQA